MNNCPFSKGTLQWARQYYFSYLGLNVKHFPPPSPPFAKVKRKLYGKENFKRMKTKPVKLPSYTDCVVKGKMVTHKLFKVQINGFYKFIKEYLKKEQRDYVIVIPPYFKEYGEKAVIQIEVDDQRNQFEIVISAKEIYLHDSYNSNHHQTAPITTMNKLLKEVKKFIGDYVPR